MKIPKLNRNARPLIWFTAALTLFLAIGVAISISQQRALLLEQLNAHMEREAGVLKSVIAEDLLRYNHAGVKRHLTDFAVNSTDITSIRAVAPNGTVVAEYSRPGPATTTPLKRAYDIKPGDPAGVTIEMIHDLEPLHQALKLLIAKNIAASIIFASAMAFFLWLILKKTAFIPLENALQELNTVNAGLEQHVEERTVEWMRANTALKSEIAEREAAQRELVIKDRAIATSVNGIAFMDFEGKVTYVNSSCLSMWGYRDRGEVVGRSSLDFWQSRETAEKVLGVLQTLGVWSGELVAQRKDGSVFHVQVSADIVKDRSGKPLCFMAAILDITERKQAEQRLRESESKFKTFSEQAIVGIYLIQDGRVKYTNPWFSEMFGYGPGQLPADPDFRQFIHPDDIIAVGERLKKRIAGQVPSSNFNFRGIKKNGETIYLEVYGAVIDYEGRPAAIGTLLDITKRVTAAEELKKSEAKHRMVVENISEIIYNMTLPEGRLQGVVDFLSGSVQETIGYGINDFLRDPTLWIRLVHPDDLPGVKEDTRRMVRDGMEVTRLYRVLHRETQEYLWLEDRIVPQFNSEGAVVGYFGVARDITRRKQAEDSLKDALIRAEEEKNKSEAIIAAIGDGISIQDRDFRVLFQNARHSALVGYHVGEFCYQAFHQREDVCPGCPVAASYVDGKVHIAERSRVTESGTFYVDISASPLRDASGEIVAGIELVRNITDRKQAAEGARRAYETQSVINSLLQVSLDKKPMEQVLLKALETVLSSSWYAPQSKGAIFLSEANGDLVLKVESGIVSNIRESCSRVAIGKCLCGRAAQSGVIQFAPHLDERHDVHFEGMPPHGHYCVPIVASGRVLGVLSLCLEDGHPYDANEQEFLSAVANALAGIIERKHMEEEREAMILDLQALLDKVSASRLEWQETFDSITDMISIHDEEYRIIKANRAFARRFGLSPRDVINKKCYELFHDEHAPILECPHRKTLERSGPVTEEVADPKTGRMFLISTFPFYSVESGKRGIVHIARDVTEAKENETRLMMSERLAALGKMASGIAHEINNPLAAIAGCVDGMNRRISRGIVRRGAVQEVSCHHEGRADQEQEHHHEHALLRADQGLSKKAGGPSRDHPQVPGDHRLPGAVEAGRHRNEPDR